MRIRRDGLEQTASETIWVGLQVVCVGVIGVKGASPVVRVGRQREEKLRWWLEKLTVAAHARLGLLVVQIEVTGG